jgi:hypothetical protein
MSLPHIRPHPDGGPCPAITRVQPAKALPDPSLKRAAFGMADPPVALIHHGRTQITFSYPNDPRHHSLLTSGMFS